MVFTWQGSSISIPFGHVPLSLYQKKIRDTFWRVSGLIDGFNTFHSKIDTGEENKSDVSISAIRFWTTPKGDLFKYSKPETLGTELNN